MANPSRRRWVTWALPAAIGMLYGSSATDVYDGGRFHSSFFLILGLSGQVVAMTLLWLALTGRARRWSRSAFEYGVETALRTSMTSVRLMSYFQHHFHGMCEICTASITDADEASPFAIKAEPGPGNPPLYWVLSFRCPTHADLDHWPATVTVEHKPSSERRQARTVVTETMCNIL